MSTHNICFCAEIRKMLCRYHLLPGAMHDQVLLINTQNMSSWRNKRYISIFQQKNIVLSGAMAVGIMYHTFCNQNVLQSK